MPVLLDENLRKTLPIAQAFASLTTMQMRYRGGDGDPVKFVACTDAEALGAADDEVEALLEEGWPQEYVVLLTTGKRHPERVERRARGQDHYWEESFYDTEDAFYGHVLGSRDWNVRRSSWQSMGSAATSAPARSSTSGSRGPRDRLVVCRDPLKIRSVGGDGVAHRLGTCERLRRPRRTPTKVETA